MRIGFIAMSGVRAHNEELTRLGLTLPGFVERNKIIASMPSLSLLTLAALTPAKFEIEYREIADLQKEPALPDDYDLVAISSFGPLVGSGSCYRIDIVESLSFIQQAIVSLGE